MKLRVPLIALTILATVLIGSVGTATAASAAAPRESVAVAGPCPYDAGHPELRRGSSGEAVRHLQCLLREVWRYGVTVDSSFGPITEAAVIAHQRDCGIAADGIVGPNTWRALHPDTASAACRD
jgi:peptidoglycan hydrolase-like protein with peptidoglycan-binding domain